MSPNFAVVDLETTGLFPEATDRILEVAVIRLDRRGKVVDEYATLVNPDRDVGPTYLHGIHASDVLEAPRFSEIAGDVASLLRGAVFVAHNVSFDRRFIQAEFRRLGVPSPELQCLCTMQLARHAGTDIPGRKLHVLCDHFGIPLEDAHTAYCDAKAAMQLLRTCVDLLGGWEAVADADWLSEALNAHNGPWPDLAPTGRCYRRPVAAMDAVERNAYIRRLVARLPAEVSADPLLDDYFAVLDRVLEDRRVLPEEASALEDLARSLGISRHAAVDAHRRYMSGLIAVALRDGTITPAEMVDLEQVRDLLGLSSADLAELVKTARVADNDREDNSAVPPASNLAGKSVCFTGTFSCLLKGERGTKETAAQLAADAGMHVRKGVTKKLDMLVAADPDSMSGKARKARQYGIRIVAEPVFWRMMGVDIE